MAEAKLVYVVIACFSIAFSVWLRAIRWQLLIKSDKVNIGQLYNIEMIGYFVNNVFPLRAGEIYRGILLSNKRRYCSGNSRRWKSRGSAS